MSSISSERSRGVYTIECDGRRLCVIYNAAEIGNPPDHVPDKWYIQPYPVELGLTADEPFDSIEEAERAAHARYARIVDAPTLP